MNLHSSALEGEIQSHLMRVSCQLPPPPPMKIRHRGKQIKYPPLIFPSLARNLEQYNFAPSTYSASHPVQQTTALKGSCCEWNDILAHHGTLLRPHPVTIIFCTSWFGYFYSYGHFYDQWTNRFCMASFCLISKMLPHMILKLVSHRMISIIIISLLFTH